MRNTRALFICSLSMFAAAQLLAACTFRVPVEPAQAVERPTGVAQIPATVGIYYSPEFLSFEHRQTIGGGHQLQFDLGEASADQFDQVFLALFEGVEIVDQRPPLPTSSPAVDAVIEPRFESVEVQDPSLFGWAGTWDVRITYLFTMFTTEGEPVASWTVTGVGYNTTDVDWTGLGGSNIAAEAANRALKDAGEKLLGGFGNVPEIRLWSKEHGYVSSLGPVGDKAALSTG